MHDERPHRTRTDIGICVTRVAGICAMKVAGLCATKVAGLCVTRVAGLCVTKVAGICVTGICVTRVAGICVTRVAGNDMRNGRGLRRGTCTARCFAPICCVSEVWTAQAFHCVCYSSCDVSQQGGVLDAPV